MHLCGIAAEDRSGVAKLRSPVKNLLPLPAHLPVPFVELAKGFEPPTL